MSRNTVQRFISCHEYGGDSSDGEEMNLVVFSKASEMKHFTSLASAKRKEYSRKYLSTKSMTQKTPAFYKEIGNSIFVDAEWNDFLNENPKVLQRIFEFLTIEDLVRSEFYVCKFWQDLILDHYGSRFKNQYKMENELMVTSRFRFEVHTNNVFEQPEEDQSKMVDEISKKQTPKRVEKKVQFSHEEEGKEIIPCDIAYDRNFTKRFLINSKDVVERYALLVRYSCLSRAREALCRYINYLLDEYTQLTTEEAKKFRHFIGWNEMNEQDRINFHQSLLKQALQWCDTIDIPTKKVTELFDLSRDIVFLSGEFAGFDVEIYVEKQGKTRVVFDEVAQLSDESIDRLLSNYSSLSFVDDDKFNKKHV
ncbi:hypothetical protein FDP41_001593 [Naegleria fowleri]|uniref:F-box domain-containing protein n=1 Tax=Naegleria fowleri TaxID=5763 RepID=A0A6A5C076_NAEFO|nr:uncharacterized protein FDP41_001593 [Naegleria fowleri]KAF0979250.1 hypothetical protein FDP41_001593 [Naegleria fowleri]CAG4712979.1 unnamed protein product [Naegleria fowleri]